MQRECLVGIRLAKPNVMQLPGDFEIFLIERIIVPSLSKAERIKRHIKRHQVSYSIGATLIFAGITCLILRGRGAGLPEITASRSETVVTRPLFFFSNNNQIITVTQRLGRGRPGNLVHCLETNRDYASQTLAAASQGVSHKIMHLHLNGKLPDVNGLHFERVNLPVA